MIPEKTQLISEQRKYWLSPWSFHADCCVWASSARDTFCAFRSLCQNIDELQPLTKSRCVLNMCWFRCHASIFEWLSVINVTKSVLNRRAEASNTECVNVNANVDSTWIIYSILSHVRKQRPPPVKVCEQWAWMFLLMNHHDDLFSDLFASVCHPFGFFCSPQIT